MLLTRNRWAPVLGLALLASGCGAARQLDDVLGAVLAPQGGATNGQLSAEITNVDTRNQYLEVRTSDGRTGQVRFDSNTKVIYQQREYPVSALERGDQVTMRVQSANNNELYTNEIMVDQSVQDRTGTTTGSTTSGLQRLEGTVVVIDNNRGVFEVRTGGTNYTVSLPYNASSTVRDRFNRMRSGDFVRLEGRWLSQGHLQLERYY